ncbi:MAG: hypothetical protein NXH95_15815 [Pseudomonadaceae bacterium]|nr:hypothetical protein [Pseudomonadaceae bacterium]
MSGSSDQITILRAKEAFTNANLATKPVKPQLKPFSMRLSADERAFLDERAGGKPWAAYIRECVFGEQATRRRTVRKPKIEDQQLASVLSELGASRLASNVNQLAKSANMGTIDVSEDVEQQLEDAAAAILAMRDALFIALGLKL